MRGIIAIDPSVYNVQSLVNDTKAKEIFSDFVLLLVQPLYQGVTDPLVLLSLDGKATTTLEKYCEIFKFSEPRKKEG